MGKRRRIELLNAEKLKIAREAKRLRKQWNKENCENNENYGCNLSNSTRMCSDISQNTRVPNSVAARNLFAEINVNQESSISGVRIHSSDDDMLLHSINNSNVNDLESAIIDIGEQYVVERCVNIPGNSGSGQEECVGDLGEGSTRYVDPVTPKLVARDRIALRNEHESSASKRLKLFPNVTEEPRPQPSDVRVISLSGLKDALGEFTCIICQSKLEIQVCFV